uniref:Protein-tyrosine phosphatase n=1 Tax=Steinernema glaseri TaxID=37863 RepID=A0A1I7YKE7_9BILA
WPPGHPNDYIHANWVPVHGEKRYICTQGPTEKTVEDFWRLVWQEKCRGIVMLCGVMELGKKKCEQYWPSQQGEQLTSGQLTIKNTKVHELEKMLVSSSLELSFQGQTHRVEHIIWNGWPDRGVPENHLACLRLVRKMAPLAPVVVHCSAGIGRTGTIVGLDMFQTNLYNGEKLSLADVVKELRVHRHGSVQTDVQFIYMHRVIFGLADNKKVVKEAEIAAFLAEYDAFIKSKGG